MTDEHWNTGFAKSLGIFLYGDGIHTLGQDNQPLRDDSFYLIFNAHSGPLDFKLPGEQYGQKWTKCWDTSGHAAERKKNYSPGDTVKAGERCVILLQAPLPVARTRQSPAAARGLRSNRKPTTVSSPGGPAQKA